MLVNDYQQRGDLVTLPLGTQKRWSASWNRKAPTTRRGIHPSRHAVYEMVRDSSSDQYEAADNESAQDLAATASASRPTIPMATSYVAWLWKDSGDSTRRCRAGTVPWRSLPPARNCTLAAQTCSVASTAPRKPSTLSSGRSPWSLITSVFRASVGVCARSRASKRQRSPNSTAFLRASSNHLAAPATEPESRSEEEDEWLTDLAGVVALERLRYLEELGRVDEVISDAGRLASQGDAPTALVVVCS